MSTPDGIDAAPWSNVTVRIASPIPTAAVVFDVPKSTARSQPSCVIRRASRSPLPRVGSAATAAMRSFRPNARPAKGDEPDDEPAGTQQQGSDGEGERQDGRRTRGR